MKQLSCRHDIKTAAIEVTQQGVGVSTSARKYIRRMAPNTAHMRNAELNEMIAEQFSRGEPVHRFKLRSGELAEIRRTVNMYYIAVIRGRGATVTRYDIIVVQPSMKDVSEEIKKKRFQPGWGTD